MFYLEGFFFCEGRNAADHGAAIAAAVEAAAASTHRTVILVYRTVGDTELHFDLVKNGASGPHLTPIPKRDAEELLRDYVKSAFTMLKAECAYSDPHRLSGKPITIEKVHGGNFRGDLSCCPPL